MQISTAGLTQYVRAKLQKHDAQQKPNRVRAITADETAWIVKSIRQALKQARQDDVALVIYAYGGFVANSYKYKAEGDLVVFSMQLQPQAKWDLVVCRDHAPKRRHGDGDLITAYLRRENQTRGRLVNV